MINIPNQNYMIENYGQTEQSRLAMEECAELIQAINKVHRKKKGAINHLTEEIADVLIMIEQLKIRINVDYLRNCIPGACFHGEVWVKCPYCGKGHELMGCNSNKKDGYLIIKCECGNYFRDR